MRLLLTGLAFSLCARIWAEPVPVADAARSAEQELRQASNDLLVLRENISTGRIPLTTRLRELEHSIAEKRAEVARIRQAGNLEHDRRENLRALARQRTADIAATTGLLIEYRRDLETRLSAAEAQMHSASLREQEKLLLAAGTATLGDAAGTLLNGAMDRIEKRLQPLSVPGVCADEQGREVPGSFGIWGPVILFAPQSQTTGPGWVAQEVGAPLPRLLPATEDSTVQNLRSLLSGRASHSVSVDITGGTALRVEAARESLWQHVVSGGAIMIPIGLVGLAAGLLVLVKSVSLARMKAWDGGRIEAVSDHIRSNQLASARTAADSAARPLRAVLQGAVDHPVADRERLEEILHERILGEIPHLEKHLAAIAVLASVAPLLGLLGTVTGMIHTFKMLMLAGAGDPRLLSGGISEALITTEAGLFIAIPALLLHAALSRRVRGLVGHLERAAVTVANRLHGPGGDAP